MQSCIGEEADNADETKGPGEIALFAAVSFSIAPRARSEIPFVDGARVLRDLDLAVSQRNERGEGRR